MPESNRPSRRPHAPGRIVPFRTLDEMNDPELIRAALNGDDAAFEAFMKRYTPLVAAYLHGALPNASDTEDLLQEVFFSAYGHLGRLKRPGRPGPWLLKIARNKKNDFYRQRGSQAGAPQPAANKQDDPLEDLAGAEADIASKAQQAELAAIVSESVSRMSDKYRLILNLRLLEEMATSEIAKQLDLKESTVRTRLLRGLAKLRKDLERQGIKAHEA